MTRARSHSAVLWLFAALLSGVWLWAGIEPLSRSDWLLENLLVFAVVILLLVSARRLVFSPTAYGLLSLFLALHLYGAHYTYSETPFGFWLSAQLGLQRNHYDRLVHFAFGLLLVLPLRELLQRSANLSGRWLALLCLASVMALSGLYEQMEMLAALVVAPELGTAFLGTQGDEWDAQKDTGLAATGALLALLLVRLFERRLRFAPAQPVPTRHEGRGTWRRPRQRR